MIFVAGLDPGCGRAGSSRWQGWIQGVAGLDAGSSRAGFRGRAGSSLVATEQVLSALFGPRFGRVLVDCFGHFLGSTVIRPWSVPGAVERLATGPQRNTPEAG